MKETHLQTGTSAKRWVAPIIALAIVVMIVAGGGYFLGNLYISTHWTTVYKTELDRFFGKGNWECVDQKTEISTVHKSSHWLPGAGHRGKVSLVYKQWDLQFNNVSGEEELWTITNLALKVNQTKNFVLSPKRYSNKQALTLELMDIAEGLASEDVHKEIVQSELPEKEARCIGVDISYTGGNPEPEFYSKLAKEEWFTVEGVSAEKFLEYEEHDFYINILAYGYRMEKLTEEERQHIYDSLGNIEQKLLDKYGEHASFIIYFSDENHVSYVDGRKQ